MFLRMIRWRMLGAHYEVFLGQEGHTSALNSQGLFEQILDNAMADDMIRNVSDNEIKEAMFSMGNDKSPGPDGYTVAFFKEDWDIVRNDVIKDVKEFFTNGKLLKELNHTIIALIPKVIANRIKGSLKDLISLNQSAFVPGRSISDNILLTQELMHNYHLDRGVPRCAFKVDFQKAYDTVDWGFLKEALRGFSFHERMILWIMKCVTTTSFSISINGSLHGHFKGIRGLRQGDPLSPYLFTIVMEVLTLMLKRRVREGDGFTFNRYYSKIEVINLCFADDLFLFAHGDVQSTKIIMESLDDFKLVSGLMPSLPKSTAYFCNVLNHVKLAILQVMPFKEGSLPVKYLGVSLVPSRLVYKDCSMRKGKAKVAWDVVCLPKDEGGLGVRRLDFFNKALMSVHIWKLLLRKDSLWVKWIHLYKIKDRNFWDIPCCGNMTWGWRKVADLLGSGALEWPHELGVKYPNVLLISSHQLNQGVKDKLEWHSRSGAIKPFVVNLVWQDIRPRDVKVAWVDAVWLHMRDMAYLSHLPPYFDEILDYIVPMAKRRTSKSVISKLVLAASAYFIWQERNERLFKGNKRTVSQVNECIMSAIRLKLMSCRFKKSKVGLDLMQCWKLPESLDGWHVIWSPRSSSFCLRMSTPVFVNREIFTQADRAQSSRVPVPLFKDPYEAIRQAYLVETDIESEPFEGPVETETPESPNTVASPTSLPDSTPLACHVKESEDSDTSGARSMSLDSTAPLSPDHSFTRTSPTRASFHRRTARMTVRAQPVMSPGHSARVTEAMALSDLAFRKRYTSSYETPSSSSSLAFLVQKRYRGTSELILDTDSEEDKIGEEDTDEDEGHGLDDEGHGLDDKDHSLDDEGHGHRELAVDEDQVYSTFEVGQGSRSVPKPKRPERLSALRQPTLTTWIDLDDAPSAVTSPILSPMISLTVPSPIASPVATPTATISVDEDQFIEVGAQLELHGKLEQERTTMTFGALWRPVLALEAWAGHVDTWMTDLPQAGYDDHRLIHDMLVQ
ncbi:putative reverse transcriptase domain, reverse transcriptase zinc-binding domain protein [Tanacetum coccineum]